MGSGTGVVLSCRKFVLNQHQSGHELHCSLHMTWPLFSTPYLDPKNKPRGDSEGDNQLECQNMAWTHLFIAKVRNMT